MPHVKPTQEELQANIDKSLEEAEQLETQPPQEVEKPTEDVSTETQTEEAKEKSEEKTEDIDYKEKFKHASKEAIVLHSKNKKLNDAIENANNLPEPTDEELLTEYGKEWEEMSSLERRFARDNYLNKKKFDLLSSVTSEFKEVEQWSEKVSTFIEDPKTLTKYPSLEGQSDEFIAFSTRPSRRGADMDLLVSAFLFESKPKKNTGALFETATGGSKVNTEAGTLSPEEGRKLRETDYKKWTEFLKEGKIRQTSI